MEIKRIPPERWTELQAGAIPTEEEQITIDKLLEIVNKQYEETSSGKAAKKFRADKARAAAHESLANRNKRRNLRRKLRNRK